MDRQQIEGKAKEEWGDVTDDPSTEMEGKAEQWTAEAKERAGGTAENTSGDEETASD